MKAQDYLAGMTQSEAIHYIQTLPGLSREEFAELMRVAQTKPSKRYGPETDLAQISKQRVEEIVRFVRKRRTTTRREMINHFRWNGTTLYFTIRHAQALGFIASDMNERREKVYRVAK